jgi:uncharacterized membrane protein (DUF485 family)
MDENKTYKNILTWKIPEYKKVKRSKRWYILAGVLFFMILFFNFFTISSWRLVFLGSNSNYLFSLIIIIALAIMLINESQEPLNLRFSLTPEGVKIGKRFYDYDEFKHFYVIYKPRQSVKQLYLEFNNNIRPRLSIPLRRMDALEVRNYLVKYLDEDLERNDQPLSEQLTRILRL